MENNNHQKSKKKLKKIGLILLILGGISVVIGFTSFALIFHTQEFNPLVFLLYIGFPMLGVGLILTVIGNHREINKFMKDESVPIVKETYQDLKPEIKDFVKVLKSSEEIERGKICPSCGAECEEDDRFCKKCGVPLEEIRCPNCSSLIDNDSIYCSKCGAKIK